MAGRPKIFISHSSDDGSDDPEARWARDVREALTERLAQPDEHCTSYDVLVDRTGLKAGRSWRTAINGWMGTCDAAVLLLSNKALESGWVAYEASVVAWRKQVSGDAFAFVPVHLVEPRDLDWERIDPTQVLQGQGVVAAYDEAWDDAARAAALDDAYHQVREALAGLVPADAPPIARTLQHVRAALQTIGPGGAALVSQSIAELSDVVDGWTPPDDDVERIARCMATLGLDRRVAKCLRRLAGRMNNQGMCEVVDALSSSWVDGGAAAVVAGATDTTRVVASNVENADTAWFYMWAQTDVPPSQSWKVAPVVWQPRADDPDGDSLLAAIDVALYDLLKRESRADVVALLSDLAYADDRVFAAVRHDGLDATLLDRVLRTFPELCLFLFGSDRERAARTVVDSDHADRIFLAPAVDQDDEEHYRSIRARVRNALRLEEPAR